MGMSKEPDVHCTCYRHQLSSSNWLNSVRQNDSASEVSQKRNQLNTQFTKPDHYSFIPINIINLSPPSFDNRRKNKRWMSHASMMTIFGDETNAVQKYLPPPRCNEVMAPDEHGCEHGSSEQNLGRNNHKQSSGAMNADGNTVKNRFRKSSAGSDTKRIKVATSRDLQIPIKLDD
ncbi:hypothetical protein CLF_108515 [Clonorchis sinensis]|uniref:Uncharacterized protein n=1 Tax=Clonorchis sinensis TaxID=79923 RepID=G7YI68_CLOSI|nr:hypothetical protein CLF_108515 [Clonorchis sinensis]